MLISHREKLNKYDILSTVQVKIDTPRRQGKKHSNGGYQYSYSTLYSAIFRLLLRLFPHILIFGAKIPGRWLAQIHVATKYSWLTQLREALIGRQSRANHMFPVTRHSWPNCGKISRPLIGLKPRGSWRHIRNVNKDGKMAPRSTKNWKLFM